MQNSLPPEVPMFLGETPDFDIENIELPMSVCYTKGLVDSCPAERPKAVGETGRDDAETSR